ncbi:hypothetical protein [Streptomyces uncialis]|uniref:hypothetical protein n=1 Tax=Streptomyces uncialis TaxID=1048205 RepID=UPI00378AF83B
MRQHGRDAVVAPAQRVDPAIAKAVERQNAAMCELRRRAFPETDVGPADAPPGIEATREQHRRQAAAAEAAALRRARTEHAARQAGAPAVQAEPLRKST